MQISPDPAPCAVNQARCWNGWRFSQGMKVEVLSADHLNKPDVGATNLQRWFDRTTVSI